MNGKYDDIIHLSRPASANRAKMSALDRAAQFSPFAALTGYEEAIRETGRHTETRLEISESRSAELNRVIHLLLEQLDCDPKIRVTFFQPDESKEGGAYVTRICSVCKVDLHHREILTRKGERIFMDDIWEMELV